MNGSIVADTSLLVNFFNGLPITKTVLEGQEIWVSSITEIELLSYRNLTKEDGALIRSFLEECQVIDFYSPIRQLAINYRRKNNLKVPDAIIAGTSRYLGFPLVTMDQDFNRLSNLDIIFLEQ